MTSTTRSQSPLKRERDEDTILGSIDPSATASSTTNAPKRPALSPTNADSLNGDNASSSSTPATPITPVDPESLEPWEKLEAIFRNMCLRRIVKENHGGEINQLAFFLDSKYNKAPFGLDQVKTFDKRGSVKRDPSDTSNILGTTGGCQANIYDNEHCGDHLDIMSHFLLDPPADDTEDVPEMLSCVWMHQPQDAILAIAGTDRLIHILSLARSKELRRLAGHNHIITDLQVHPTRDDFLLSASKDGNVRLWNIATGQCLYIYEIKASVTCFAPDGQSFVTGSYSGNIQRWQIPTLDLDLVEPIVIGIEESEMLKEKMHAARVDCIRACGSMLLSKSVNGRVEYWDPKSLEIHRSFLIKNSASNQCRFDVSMDEKFFCVGTSNGSVYIYNIETGKTVTELKHRRSTKAIRTCAFSRDCRSVVCGGEDSFIWRYDYVTDETLAEWANWKGDT